MWPRRLPQEVLENPLRFAEIKVYNLLNQVLDESFTVFYSRPWLGLTPSGAERDGECDFFVAHAEHGLLAIEVKGGSIAYDPAHERWSSTDRYGIVHSIKNPVAQARTAKHAILEKLHKSHGWHSRRVSAHHGVIFPDCYVPAEGLGVDAPRRIVCSLDDWPNLRQWILARMTGGTSAGEQALGRDGVRALENLLARPFMLKTPLGHLLAEDERALESLTPQQFQILESIQDIPRAGVAGGAGTGKTVLAIEEARRFAEAGRKTLLICHSKPLSADFKRRVKGIQNLEAAGFHELCLRLATKAGLSFEVKDDAQFFDEVAPELLMTAIERRPDLEYDAVIVDEGQDFRALWWIALEATVRRGEQSRLHVYYDCNQRVYERGGRPPDDFHLVPIRLTRNLRNTRAIHDASMRHYVGFPIHPNHLDGVAIEAHCISEAPDVLRWIDAKVHHLTGPERLSAGDIAIVTTSSELVALIRARGKVGGELITDAAAPDDEAVAVDTIRRFKGLERLAVIVIADQEILDAPELAYVALSRARTLLSAYGPTEVLTALFGTRKPV